MLLMHSLCMLLSPHYGLFIGVSGGLAFAAFQSGSRRKAGLIFAAAIFAAAAITLNRHGIGFGLLEETLCLIIAAAFGLARTSRPRRT